tara:strand:+ start:304 stop:678 length:375 start_codon:yes stop_codon:yes gene_type:complete
MIAKNRIPREIIDPEKLIGRFVHRFYKLIEPALKRRDFFSAIGFIEGELEKSKMGKKDSDNITGKASDHYERALMYLGAVADKKEPLYVRELDHMMSPIATEVRNLDREMANSGSKLYEEERRR